MSRTPWLVIAVMALVVGVAAPVVAEPLPAPDTCFEAAVTLDGSVVGVAGERPGTGEPITVILGTPGDDVILGTPGADWIRSRGGNDLICARGGDDLVDAGVGFDSVDGGIGSDVIIGKGGFDTLIGGGGGDQISGGPGDDFIDGGNGDDLLTGGQGADTLVGGSGSDTIDGSTGPDVIDGGDGDDTLSGSFWHDEIDGGSGADTIDGGRGLDTIRGGDGDDTLDGSREADVIDGGPGDDAIRGGPGADRLDGGEGDDAVLGGSGPDLVVGGPGNDGLHGGQGLDRLQGGDGDDLLFRSEYPNRDAMDGGDGENVVGAGVRGSDAAGLRRYLTDAEAIGFVGVSKLSDFTTYHACCANRVVNIQTMADTVDGYVVMPGEWFSVNDIVGRRTSAKGYLPAGAIIGGWVQCCDLAANIGGGTSQFGTTMYNAIFFSALGDVDIDARESGAVNSPHTLYFARYPAGREATMGYPDHDVRFYNDSDHPVLVTTHHDGYSGTSIQVKIWGNTGGRSVEAVHSCRPPGTSSFPEVLAADEPCGLYYTSRRVYRPDASLDPSVFSERPGQPGFAITVDRIITFGDGSTRTETFRWAYSAEPTVVTTHPCNIPAGDPGYTGVACPGGGGGGGGDNGGDTGGGDVGPVVV